MPQSLHSLLLARNALHSIKDYTLLETTGHQPDSEKPNETIPDVRSYNNYSIREQPFDEKEVELFGNSVLMYGDLLEPAHGCLLVSKEHLIRGSNRFDQTEIEISDDIYAHSAPLVCSTNAVGDLISLKLENESLRVLLHQQRQTESLCQEEKKCLNLEIASLGHQINHSHQQSLAAAEELIISRASYNELHLKVAELENYRMTFAIDKSEHNACLKRLSSENGHLKAAQRDISAISLTTEKKIAALESSKVALLEQVFYNMILFFVRCT